MSSNRGHRRWQQLLSAIAGRNGERDVRGSTGGGVLLLRPCIPATAHPASREGVLVNTSSVLERLVGVTGPGRAARPPYDSRPKLRRAAGFFFGGRSSKTSARPCPPMSGLGRRGDGPGHWVGTGNIVGDTASAAVVWSAGAGSTSERRSSAQGADPRDGHRTSSDPRRCAGRGAGRPARWTCARCWCGRTPTSRDKAPVTAAEAATIILDQVQSGAWPILVSARDAKLDRCRGARRTPRPPTTTPSCSARWLLTTWEMSQMRGPATPAVGLQDRGALSRW